MPDVIQPLPVQSMWWRVWKDLTSPHASFTSINDIRRSRMTMVFSLALAAICLVGSLASWAGNGSLHAAVFILWLVTALCMGTYFVARTRYYKTGALLITWLFSICGYIVAINRPDDVAGALFSFVPLSLVLAGGLLSIRNQIALTVFNVVATVVFPMFAPAATDMARNAGIFMSLGVITMTISGFRDILDTSRLLTERQQADERLNYQLEMERLAAHTSAKFINSSVDEMDYAIQETLKEIGELAHIDRGYVVLYSDNMTRSDREYEWRADGIEAEIQKLQGLVIDSTSWQTSRILRGDAVPISRMVDLPPEAESLAKDLRDRGIRSTLAVPITYRAQVIGYIGVDSVRVEITWSESNITLLKMIGDIFANALERKRAEVEAETLRKNIGSQMWLTLRQAQLAENMRGEQTVEALANNVISYLCQCLEAQAGALFIVSGEKMKLTGRYAYMERAGQKDEFAFGENLVGQAAKANRIIRVDDIPADAPLISSALGDAMPRQLLIAPIETEGQVVGVAELAMLNQTSVDAKPETFLRRVSESIAIAFRTAQTRAQVNELLAQSQLQAEELRTQEEELRAANEELLSQADNLKTARDLTK